MVSSFCLQLLILTSVVSIYVRGAGFRCKAVDGCEIARCDPSPFSWGHLEKNEFPINCVSDGNHVEKNYGGDMANLNKEMERLWDMNRLQNDKLDKIEDMSEDVQEIREANEQLESKMSKMKKDMKDINELQKKNERLQINMTRIMEEVEDIQELRQMDAHLQTTVAGMREEMNDIAELRKDVDYLKASVKGIQEDSKGVVDMVRDITKQIETILSGFNSGEPTPTKSLRPSSTTQRTPSSLRNGCRQDEFLYDNVCYWLDVRYVNSVTYVNAEAICKSRNSALAYPVDRHHFQLIQKNAQNWLSEELPLIRVWTGIRQNPNTGRLFVDGSSKPYVQWGNREPDRNPTDTRVMMWLNRDGLYDANPSSFGDGAFCMYAAV